MGRVLCISSQTVYGPVGNSAAVPALQEMGHEVMAVPTVVLSNHPGHGKPVGQVTAAPLLEQMLETLNGLGAFKSLDAVLTGYFANAAQVLVAAGLIRDLAKQNQDLHVLVDPVIGDHGKLYVAEEVAVAIGDHLVPLATILTPNLFELTWLAQTEVISSAVQTVGPAHGAGETLVTSIPERTDKIITLLHFWESLSAIEHVSQRQSGVPNGTGDFLAGAYLARRLLMPAPQAFEGAMERLTQVIDQSVGLSALVVSRKPSA